MTWVLIKNVIEKIQRFILDTIFPVRCVSCKKEGSWICKDCFAQIKTNNEQVCGICEKMITPDGRTCLSCKKPTRKKSAGAYLDGFVVASSYSQKTISKAVHIFKYRFVSDLHRQLGDLMVEVLSKTNFPLPDLIVPVPLHPRRLRWRGFNQSALLADRIASELLIGTKMTISEKILMRNRHTTPQMSIKDFSSRKENTSGAFSVLNTENIQGKSILLVDDIATTGSTIFECAKTLKEAGAKEVFAAVIARQETKK